MEKKRYESPLFMVGLFIIIGLGLLVSALDPTGIAAGNGQVIKVGSLSGINLVLLSVSLGMIVLGLVIRFVAIATVEEELLRPPAHQGRPHPGQERHLPVDPPSRVPRGHPALPGLSGYAVQHTRVPGHAPYRALPPARIKAGGEVLIGRFGAEYEDYIRSSKKLVPFVY